MGSNFSLAETLQLSGIHFIRSGKNVSAGHINIQCPFCGPADKSQHLGIRIADGVWGCWRNSEHRGRRPHRLLIALGWTPGEVERLCGQAPNLDSFEQVLRNLKSSPHSSVVSPAPAEKIILPKEFISLDTKNFFHAHKKYLRTRGFKLREISGLCRAYGLKASFQGNFAYRIIFVMKDQEWNVQCWTGRSIIRNAPLRYLTSSKVEAVNIKECLFHWHELRLRGAEILVVCEGPFDALKLDFYGKEYGVRATCVFGSKVTPTQASLLYEGQENFGQIVVAMDPENLSGTFRSEKSYPWLNAVSFGTPLGKDFGSYSRREVGKLCLKLRSLFS